VKKGNIQSNPPLVSVLIGTYNRADLLRRAVKSVLRQHYDNFEIIVVDDASTDSTPEVVKEFGDDRVKYVRHKDNKGIAVVSNTAFMHCEGEFIALLGDDDEWTDENKLSKQVQVFTQAQNPKLAIVTTWWQDIKNGRVVRQHKPQMPADLTERMLTGNIICGSVVMFSRKAWKAVGGFDENMKRGTDSELSRSIITQGYHAEIIPEVTANIDISGNDRMTHTNEPERIKTAMQMVEYLLNKYSALYDKYPKARAQRLYQIAEFSLKTYVLHGRKEDLVACGEYIKTAFRHQISWKPILKWFVVLVFGRRLLLTYWRLRGRTEHS
jgi:glycosyltransferase involved in cell wall biosynthesis